MSPSRLPRAKPWLGEIQVARGVAILAVLAIHVTASPVASLDPRSHLYLAYVLVNRLAQFAVPSFMMISALALVYQSVDRPSVDWSEFYTRRWQAVIIPYLAWATFYMLVRIVFLHDPVPTLGHVIFWYTSGKVYYHLYFMSAIIQFYLLFPLVFRGWRELKPSFTLTVVIAAAAQVLLYLGTRTYLYPYFPYPSTIVLSYTLPISIGLWLGANSHCWTHWWQRYRFPIILAALVGGVAYVSLFILGARGLATRGDLSQASWYLYVTAAGVIVLFASRWLLAFHLPLAQHLARWLERLGEVSFGIYLVHPAFLALWQKLWQPSSPVPFHLSVAGGFLVMLYLSWWTVWVVERTPLAGVLFGRRRIHRADPPATHT